MGKVLNSSKSLEKITNKESNSVIRKNNNNLNSQFNYLFNEISNFENFEFDANPKNPFKNISKKIEINIENSFKIKEIKNNKTSSIIKLSINKKNFMSDFEAQKLVENVLRNKMKK